MGSSTIAIPLTHLTCKGVLFAWSEEGDSSFLRLKEFLTTTYILILPIEVEGFTVYCDASRIGLSYVLMQ